MNSQGCCWPLLAVAVWQGSTIKQACKHEEGVSAVEQRQQRMLILAGLPLLWVQVQLLRARHCADMALGLLQQQRLLQAVR